MANVDSLTVKLHVDVKTLRDEFAMAALPSVIDAMGSIVTPSKVADISYQYADAMMEVRKS